MHRALTSGLKTWLTKPRPIGWQPLEDLYPRLEAIEHFLGRLRAVSGVYVIWHLGVRPRWLRVAATADLETALAAAKADSVIAELVVHGGVFVSWFPCAPAEALSHQAYLVARLEPMFRHVTAGDLVAQGPIQPRPCPLPPDGPQPAIGGGR